MTGLCTGFCPLRGEIHCMVGVETIRDIQDLEEYPIDRMGRYRPVGREAS